MKQQVHFDMQNNVKFKKKKWRNLAALGLTYIWYYEDSSSPGCERIYQRVKSIYFFIHNP